METPVRGRDRKSSGAERGQDVNTERRRYLRFGAMIATSTVVMFLLTYTNTYAWSHVRWSAERIQMALLIGGAMAS
jgi:hypothetical protein